MFDCGPLYASENEGNMLMAAPHVGLDVHIPITVLQK